MRPKLFRFPEIYRRGAIVADPRQLQCKLCYGVKIDRSDEYAIRQHGDFHKARGEATGAPGSTKFRLSPLGIEFAEEMESQGSFRLDPTKAPLEAGVSDLEDF